MKSECGSKGVQPDVSEYVPKSTPEAGAERS